MSKQTTTLPTPPIAAPASKWKAAIQLNSEGQLQKEKSVSEQAIRVRAYQIWEAAGKPSGDGARFWLQAERELLQAE